MTVEQRATGHSWPRHFVAATCSSLLRGETLTWRERGGEGGRGGIVSVVVSSFFGNPRIEIQRDHRGGGSAAG